MSPSNLLLREAAYRAVGEGFAHVAQHIDFTAWYAAELQGLLEKGYTVSRPYTVVAFVTQLCWLSPPAGVAAVVIQLPG